MLSIWTDGIPHGIVAIVLLAHLLYELGDTASVFSVFDISCLVDA